MSGSSFSAAKGKGFTLYLTSDVSHDWADPDQGAESHEREESEYDKLLRPLVPKIEGWLAAYRSPVVLGDEQTNALYRDDGNIEEPHLFDRPLVMCHKVTTSGHGNAGLEVRLHVASTPDEFAIQELCFDLDELLRDVFKGVVPGHLSFSRARAPRVRPIRKDVARRVPAGDSTGVEFVVEFPAAGEPDVAKTLVDGPAPIDEE